MRELNLYKLWEVCNKLSEKESELSEGDVFISLLGNTSNYSEMCFEGFLNYYSFKIDGEDTIIYNDDSVQWEDYRNNDFSTFPLFLLSFGEKELNIWIEQTIKKQLEEQEANKIAEKEEIKRKIELLTKRLEEY